MPNNTTITRRQHHRNPTSHYSALPSFPSASSLLPGAAALPAEHLQNQRQRAWGKTRRPFPSSWKSCPFLKKALEQKQGILCCVCGSQECFKDRVYVASVLQKKRGRPSAPDEPLTSTTRQVFPGSAHDPTPRRSSHWGNPGECQTQRFNRVMVVMVGFTVLYQPWKTDTTLSITPAEAAQECRTSSKRWILHSHPDLAERLSPQKKPRVAEKSETAAKTYATSSPPRWFLVSHLPQTPHKLPSVLCLFHLSFPTKIPWRERKRKKKKT